MRGLRGHFLLALIVTAIWSAVMIAGQQAVTAGPFTAAQAAAGRTAYQANCSSCHLPTLGGQGDIPPLAGAVFVGAWRNRTTRDLLSFIQLTMPPNNAGGLSQQDYTNIAAFILQSNGATAGNQQLTANTEVSIGSVASARAPAAAGQEEAQQRPAVTLGLTVSGEVKNYVPVTDAMLRNPDPSDWLMIRRTYQASNYSPLTQITRDNVRDLHLQWVWAMTEGGTSQPAPIVHNGIVYLNNPGNLIQAIDGRTGELIWENRYGTSAAAAAMRGISIYNDKIFVATTDANLVAFDARTGKTVWQTVVGDRSKGSYTTSSGPLLAKGKVIQGLGSC